MTTFDIIKKLAEKQKMSIVELEEKLGFSRNSLYAWKKSKPSVDKLQAVADYFHVSTDYLLGRTDDPDISKDSVKTADLADDEAIFTFQGRPLSDEDRKIIKRLMNGK